MPYKESTSIDDAIGLIEGPFCRKHYQSILRDRVAKQLQIIVAREVEEARLDERKARMLL